MLINQKGCHRLLFIVNVKVFIMVYLLFSGRGRGARTPTNKAAPTAEELDAELDAYSKEMK